VLDGDQQVRRGTEVHAELAVQRSAVELNFVKSKNNKRTIIIGDGSAAERATLGAAAAPLSAARRLPSSPPFSVGAGVKPSSSPHQLSSMIQSWLSRLGSLSMYV
jgi:hypothetical protein